MPDWSYQTIFRPLLFRMDAERARDLTLGTMGLLSRVPLGPRLIELMGHMAPPGYLSRSVAGITYPAPVGLDAGLDPNLLGLVPLSQFGFGYLETGPVTLAPVSGPAVRRLEDEEGIWYPDLPVNPGLETVGPRLRGAALRVPLGVRLAHASGATAQEATAERCQLIRALAGHVAFFSIEIRGGDWSAASWEEHVGQLVALTERPIFIVLPPDTEPDRAEALTSSGCRAGIAGLIISGGVSADQGRVEGRRALAPALRLLTELRSRLGGELPIIAGGGIHEPADALRFYAAGASLVQVHAGLVYGGPGLPKRINEAVGHLAPAEEISRQGWLPAALMASGIGVGALLAAWIALTRVLLPYDEAFVGLDRAAMAAINPRLLAFLEHDRITLAGVMGASALLFFCIALFPWRQGEHWARPALLYPALFGFLSFFLFPAYGYMEPLHLIFYLCLLPFFAAAWLQRQRGRPAAPPASLYNDRRWRRGLWGQLLWIILAAGGIGAGVMITLIGLTSVFVPEDLAFMQTGAETLRAVPRLVPLIAHDRVGVGTSLISNGLTVLLMALWGYRQGARWLWWTFFAAGVPSYLAAFLTHFAVGYVDLWHLTPPIAGLLLLVSALALSYPYLNARAGQTSTTTC